MKSKRPSQPGFTHIKELIDQIIGNCRISDNSEFIEIQKSWAHNFASEITENAQPAALKNGILFIQVKSSTLIYQLRFMANDIIALMNQVLGDERISGIKFKIR
jgi:hypothetical protein